MAPEFVSPAWMRALNEAASPFYRAKLPFRNFLKAQSGTENMTHFLFCIPLEVSSFYLCSSEYISFPNKICPFLLGIHTMSSRGIEWHNIRFIVSLTGDVGGTDKGSSSGLLLHHFNYQNGCVVVLNIMHFTFLGVIKILYIVLNS